MIHNPKDGWVRYVIRKTRIEKGLRQRDVADLHISDGTISNIERGKGEVTKETFDYLLEKLGLCNEKLSQLIEEEKEKCKHLKFELDSIESLIENNSLDDGYEQLEIMDITELHPLYPFVCYLKGLYFYKKRQWKSASKSFKKAINICFTHKIELYDNIIAMTYNQLSRCSFHQNNLHEALAYVDKGLDEYDETKEKKDAKYPLYSNKILYLMRLSEFDYASQILTEIWPSIQDISKVPVVLNLYKYRAILLRERKKFNKAIMTCNEGINLARNIRIQNRHLDLLNVLGSIHMKEGKFDMALSRFEWVLKLDKHEEYPRIHLDSHTYLGMLYSTQQDWQKANDHLKKAIELGKESTDVLRLTKALIVQGDYFYKQKKYDEAIPYYQEANDLAEEKGFQHRQFTALLKLSNCFAMMKKITEQAECNVKLIHILNQLGIRSEGEFFDV